MKHNLILWASAAFLAVLAGCQKPAEQQPAQLSIDADSEIEVPANGYAYLVNLTATVDWELQGYDEKAQAWLTVKPTSGKASSSAQKVTITALGNDGPARSATLTFYGNADCNASITFNQAAGSGAVSPDAGSSIYSISFLEDMGGFTIEDKDKPSAIDAIWTWSSQYGMVGTGYDSGSQTNYASESWLVSPLIDLSFEQSAYLTFKHATNFFSNVSVLPDQASVWAREEDGNWAKLDGICYPGQLGWTFVDAGYADLSDYAGKKMQFAFAYKSTAEKAGTWEVKRVSVTRTAPPAAMTSDKPGVWMEMPAFEGGSDLYLITHDMEHKGKFMRNYTYCYSPEDKVALWVAYPLNKDLKGSGSRTDEWGLDPKVPREYQPILYKTYGDGIYDRGHQLPSADRLDEAANISTFYFTNMAPQLSDLNQGAIANLENMVRDWSYQMDTLYVVTGSDLQGATEVAHDNEGNEITVPSGFFKALLGYDAGGSAGSETERYFGIAFYFEHKDGYAGGKAAIMEQSMSIDALEEKLGYDLFANLPAKIGDEAAAAVESSVDEWWK